MNPPAQDNIPYIMGSYEYYPEDANLFAFNNEAGFPNNAPNSLWFAQPQTVYAHNPDNFVFDSNPYMVSAPENADNAGIDKHYDNPVNISSWITTASPNGYVYQFGNTVANSNCRSIPTVPAPSMTSSAHDMQATTFLPVNQGDGGVGGFPPVDLMHQSYGSPYPSSGIPFFTPHSRVISTSTSASSCPGSSGTLATPRFDPTTHFAPFPPVCEEIRYRKSSWPNPVTPDTSDVFTTVPLVPPPMKDAVPLRQPEGSRLPGESPAVATSQQAMFTNMPRQSLNGRSLRSTPSLESLRSFSEEQDSSAQKNGPKPLMSPFSSLALEATSMHRTYSAPCSFLNDCSLGNSTPPRSRQVSGDLSSPFTSAPLVSSLNPNHPVKVVKRKSNTKLSLTAPSMMRSVTTSGLSTSPLWSDGWSAAGHSSLGAPRMIRSASASDFAKAPAIVGSGPLTLSHMDGWTSQVPQPSRRGAGLQASEAADTSCVDATTSIPALTILPAEESSPFSSEPRHLTIPGTGIARPTKKIPKRAQAESNSVKLTFMNFGPKDGEEITNAVAESGKSKRKRPDDFSSCDDSLGRMKRTKSQSIRGP